jgi:hypothetical protein
MALAELIADPDAGVTDIAALLDAMQPDARTALLRTLGRAQQRALYAKADPASMDLGHLVGRAGPLVEVIHDGWNTLPVPPPIRRFQKRFCRPADPSAEYLFGYNEGPTRRLLGPGYFVARPGRRDPVEGGVVVDYHRVPGAAVPSGWPPVVANSHGLQRFVYQHARDHLRRVSAEVCVGAAYKRDQPLDHYFILCRRPA